MKNCFPVLGLALGGLCLISCDNKDRTVAELTGKLLDVQTRVGALESLQTRVAALETMGQRISVLEAAEKRYASLESLRSRVTALETLTARVAALENLESRITVLETLPARVRSAEALSTRIGALETLQPRVSELEKLTARVAVLEEQVRAQAAAPKTGDAPKAETDVQRVLALLEEYSILDRKSADGAVFVGHMARIDHGDATMTDFPVLAEMLNLGSEDNPVPMSCVKTMVEAGASIHTPMTAGMTPLMAACSIGSPDIVRYLLENGADAKAEDADGDTAIRYALHLSNGAKCAEILRSLCAAGCDVNCRTSGGGTPLVEAVYIGADYEMVEALLSLGADVTATTAEGGTIMDMLSDGESGCSTRTRELLMEAWEKAHIQPEEPAPAETPAQ